MIHVIDNFLEEAYYVKESLKLQKGKNNAVLVGDKVFHVQEASDVFVKKVINKLEKIEQRKIDPILYFFRCATDVLDVNWRIHSDYIINGVHPKRACVYYMSKSQLDELNGTAFWEHHEYGDSLPKNVTNDEFDRMIIKESEDLTKWKLKTVVDRKSVV